MGGHGLNRMNNVELFMGNSGVAMLEGTPTL